jgi:hypothetical protein
MQPNPSPLTLHPGIPYNTWIYHPGIPYNLCYLPSGHPVQPVLPTIRASRTTRATFTQIICHLHILLNQFPLKSRFNRGCQMLYFQKPKIPIWVNFGEICNGKYWPFYINLVYLMSIWYTYFMVIRYIFPLFGTLYKEKSVNPGLM